MNEKELIKRAQSGDFEAFSILIEGHKDKIYRLALKLTGNREDAEDIVQETLMKAIDAIDKFRMEASFGTWLYSIALNNIRAHTGDRKRAALKPLEEYLPNSHSDSINSELFDWGDPHQLFERKQLNDIIESSLAELPLKYSVPFTLRYMEDMPVKDVARVLKLSLPATKSRILRARLALKEKLDDIFRERSDERV